MCLAVLWFCVICAPLPAGMVARQPLSTFTADSATAVGVRASSHAGEETRNKVNTLFTKDKDVKNEMKSSRRGALTFSAAGHGALEGAGDGLPGFLLGRSLFQRRRVDELTVGRGHLRTGRQMSYDGKNENKNAKPQIREELHDPVCERVLLMFAQLVMFALVSFCYGLNCCYRF